jgi:hypothetical protein
MLVLVPLAITHERWMDAYTQVPKIFVLRTLTLFILAALTAAVALSLATARWQPLLALRNWRDSASRHPARLVLLAVALIAYANVLATALSPVPEVSIAGANAGRVSGGLLTQASYLVVFFSVVTHLRTKAQLMRMLWATAGAAWLVSLYGIGQHFGLDWFLTEPYPAKRVTLTFGNLIFAGSLLTMTAPLSLALAATLRGRTAPIIGGLVLVTPQIAAIAFTLTRGAWIGAALGFLTFLVIISWTTDRHRATNASAILALILIAAVLLVALPVSGQPRDSNLLASRLASIPQSVSPEGGLSARYAIWVSTIHALTSPPWPDDSALPAIPSLPVKALRPLVGYGPDMYTYVYPLTGDTLSGGRTEYAHNFLLHAAIEIGIFGAAAYVGLISALGLVLYRLLKQAKRSAETDWRAPLLAGLAAALVARSVEQLAGVAQPADLLLSWALAGTVVALSSTRFACDSSDTFAGAALMRSNRAAVPILGAGLLLIVLTFAWVETVFEDAYAARLVAEARAASQAGDAAHADQLFDRAIEMSPGAAVIRLRVADRMFDRAVGAPTQIAQAEVLAEAFRQTNAVQARNPLDGRSWARSVRINGMLASLLEGDFAEAALADALTLSALYPGFWQPRVEVAATRLLLNDPSGALEDLATAKTLGAEGPSASFAEAMALLAAGRPDAAVSVANQLQLDGSDAALVMHSEFLRNLALER